MLPKVAYLAATFIVITAATSMVIMLSQGTAEALWVPFVIGMAGAAVVHRTADAAWHRK